MWSILTSIALISKLATAQTYPHATGSDVAPWYFIEDYGEEGLLRIDPNTRVAYLNGGETGSYDDVNFVYAYYPYGNSSFSVRVHNDACSYAYFQNVSSATTPDAYRVVFTNVDPSGLGPVFFTWTCGLGNASTGCLGGFQTEDITGQTYSSAFGVDGDDTDEWFLLPDPVNSNVASTVTIQEMAWGTNTADAAAQTGTTSTCAIVSTVPTTTGAPATTLGAYTIIVTDEVTSTGTDANGHATTSSYETTYTTLMDYSQANVYTRSVASVSHASSVAARISSQSAASVAHSQSLDSARSSQSYIRSTHSAFVASESASRESARSSVAARQSDHSESLYSARTSRTSRQSTHSASLQAGRVSRSSVDATHYASVSDARISRSSVDATHYASVSDARVSRSIVRQSKSNAQSSATISKSLRSESVASSKSAASVSRDSARSDASASKSAASSSLYEANLSASSSRSAASASRSSANMVMSSERSVASASRASANSVLSVSRAERSSSIASVDSVISVSRASKASVLSSWFSSMSLMPNNTTVTNGTSSSASVASSSGSSASSSLITNAAERAFSASVTSHCSALPNYSVCPSATGISRRAVAPTEADKAMITPPPATGDYHYYDEESEEYYGEEWESQPELGGLEERDSIPDDNQETVAVEVILETIWVLDTLM